MAEAPIRIVLEVRPGEVPRLTKEGLSRARFVAALKQAARSALTFDRDGPLFGEGPYGRKCLECGAFRAGESPTDFPHAEGCWVPGVLEVKGG